MFYAAATEAYMWVSELTPWLRSPEACRVQTNYSHTRLPSLVKEDWKESFWLCVLILHWLSSFARRNAKHRPHAMGGWKHIGTTGGLTSGHTAQPTHTARQRPSFCSHSLIDRVVPPWARSPSTEREREKEPHCGGGGSGGRPAIDRWWLREEGACVRDRNLACGWWWSNYSCAALG